MKEKEVVKFLRERYNPKSIIFVGSRAVGDYKKGSDWDVYVFCKKKKCPTGGHT